MNIKEIIIYVVIYIAIDITADVLMQLRTKRKMRKARKIIGAEKYDKLSKINKILNKILLTGDTSLVNITYPKKK